MNKIKILLGNSKPKGTALIVALVMLICATSFMITMMEASSTNFKGADRYAEQETAYYAAQGAVNMIVSDIYGSYIYKADNLAQTRNFRISLSNRFPALNIPAVSTVMQTAVADSNSTAPQSWDVWCGKRMGPAYISRVRITRRDEGIPAGANPSFVPLYTQLMVEAEITTDAGVTANFVRSFRFSDAVENKAPDYGILTNNITCTVCHMKVQNAMKNWSNLDAMSDDNITSKSKVGTLQLLALRPGSAQSTVEGNLFQRGRFEDEFSGAAYGVSTLTGSTFKCVAAQDSQSVQLKNASGYTNYTTRTGYTSTGNDANGAPKSINDTAYLNYPTNPNLMTMGDLPTSFPSPFADTDGNKKIGSSDVNATQLNDVANGKTGGTLSAATYYTVPKASATPSDTVYNYAAMPGDAGGPSVPGTALNINERLDGQNVVLVGTYANPIKINGKVIIDGDVIIKGYVEGTGEIWASGNVYVPNDLKYKNKTQTQTIDGVTTTREVFGVATVNNADGTEKQNLLGLVAGKNLVMGDYLSSVNHWNSGRSDFIDSRNFATPEPGMKKDFTATPVDSGLNKDTSNGGSNTNFAPFVMEEISMFNRDELTKSMPSVIGSTGNPTNASKYSVPNTLYDPNYVPRMYTMYKNQKKKDGSIDTTTYGNAKGTTPIPVYLNSSSKWDSGKNFWNNTGDPHTYSTMRQLNELPAASMLNPALPTAIAADPAAIESTDKAVVLNIHPEWVPPKTMLALLINEEKSRPAEPRRVDGLLYTNNALFAIERQQTMKYTGTYDPATETWSGGSWSKTATKSGGSMQINGALIAPDMGILVTGGTKTSSTWKEGYSAIDDGGKKFERKAFTVNYDARVRELLKVTEKTGNWSYKACGSARTPGTLK